MGTASPGRKYTDERLDGGEGFNIFKDIFTEGKAESAINWPLLTSFFPSLNIILICAVLSPVTVIFLRLSG